MAKFKSVLALDMRPLLYELVEILGMDHIDPDRVHLRRSTGSTSQAYARIWELPSIWIQTLDVEPQYIIEFLSEHFDWLPAHEQTKILIHELLHIPSTFSGALRNHRGMGEPITDRTVKRYYRRYRVIKEDRERADASPQLPLPFLG